MDEVENDGQDLWGFSPTLVATAAAGLILVLLLVYRLTAGRSVRRNVILVTGLSGAGKTSLFSQLCFGRVRATVSSSVQNEGSLPSLGAAGQHLRVVDWPGHVRMRHALLDSIAPRAQGVIFVVDSTAVKKNPSDVAEYLYTLLSTPSLANVPVLVLCNKQDLTWVSLKPILVANKLEAEFNTLRETKRTSLGNVGDKSGHGVTPASFLGLREGEEFKFANLPATKVEFVPFSCVSESSMPADCSVLETWIKKVARL